MKEVLWLSHKIVYGAVPPVGVIVVDPLLAPKQVTLVVLSVEPKTAGWVIVSLTFEVHPLASVITAV